MQQRYFVYITTNPSKTALYIGVTNDLEARLYQHFQNRANPQTFAGKYSCYNLVHFEYFQYIQHAIEREKEVKKWRREKKNRLIESKNPKWAFLNKSIAED